MSAIGLLLIRMLCDCFKPRSRLEAEILILRHQLNVLQQREPRGRLHLRSVDRALFIWLRRGRYRARRRGPARGVLLRQRERAMAVPLSAASQRLG
jgi:hypothetical protein